MPKKKEELSIEERLEKAIVPKEEEPYKIPSNWVWTRLGDITEFIDYRGKTPQKVENGIPLITAKNIKKGYINEEPREFIKEEDYEGWMTRGIPQKGDVAITTEAPLGNVAQLNFDYKFALAQRVITLTNISFNKRFLFYSILSAYFQLQLKEYATGSTVEGIKSKLLKILKIALPPLEEQKRIVEKLDSLFEKIQKIKDIIEEVKEKTNLRREAVLSKAFTGELTEKWRNENQIENARELLAKVNEEKLKLWEEECKKAEEEGRKKPTSPKLKSIDEMLAGEEEIPYKVPDNWVWTRLGDITTVLSGGTPSTSKEEYYNGNIPWITPKDLSNYREKYIFNGARNITEEGLKKSSAVLLPKNSVLMSSRAPIGYVVISKSEVTTNQGFKNFIPSISYIPELLYYYLKKSKSYLESIATGTTFKELSGEKSKKILFPLPPLEEQKEIVRILDKVFEEENRISELISLEEKIEILEKTILDKAFRGELGTGSVDDEPAIELLKKVLEEK